MCGQQALGGPRGRGAAPHPSLPRPSTGHSWCPKARAQGGRGPGLVTRSKRRRRRRQGGSQGGQSPHIPPASKLRGFQCGSGRWGRAQGDPDGHTPHGSSGPWLCSLSRGERQGSCSDPPALLRARHRVHGDTRGPRSRRGSHLSPKFQSREKSSFKQISYKGHPQSNHLETISSDFLQLLPH